MTAMLLILFVSVGNFTLGFGLATYFGHGPAWAELPTVNQIRESLRSLLHLGGKQA
jgi:hypothetical protein